MRPCDSCATLGFGQSEDDAGTSSGEFTAASVRATERSDMPHANCVTESAFCSGACVCCCCCCSAGMCDDARARRRQRRRRRRRRMPFGEHVCVGVCCASAVLYLLVYVVKYVNSQKPIGCVF